MNVKTQLKAGSDSGGPMAPNPDDDDDSDA